MLDRFFNQQDTWTDFQALRVLLGLLNQERRHRWGAMIETLVFLFWLANGASYRVVSRVFAMPRSTVHRIVHRVTEEVGDFRHKVIHLLKTHDELQPISRGFAGLARHRAVGCHVHIKPPSGPDGHCYRNRKLFPFIILQAVCDHQGRFIDTYVGSPGSVHDSRVLRYSPLQPTVQEFTLPSSRAFHPCRRRVPVPPTPTLYYNLFDFK
ncbi:protein ALP1-like [Micropterus dolomieu]|uniref:protein ALP1-like n=1 Tax=Micropterus dolomieu TaxID=147949 RepID=UPI001E8E3B99|nr:protein ALP1-like [Micropterus dolomieu]